MSSANKMGRDQPALSLSRVASRAYPQHPVERSRVIAPMTRESSPQRNLARIAARSGELKRLRASKM